MIREYIIKISDEIMEAEIADRPQELVRCRNCRNHYNELKCRCGGYTPDDFYCAAGEKKEVKQNEL